jgi:AcrR family transcriptional regulator
MSPRPYRLGRRAPAAEHTRSRILAAARDLLVAAEGVAGFTIDAVAERASVARMTVYYQFKSKSGLLEALFDWLAEVGGMQELPLAFQVPEPHAALDRFILTFVRFWASDRLVLRRLRALAVTDPELEPVFHARDERRREGLGVLVGRLSPGRDKVELVDVLHALTSFEFFDDLSRGGRSPDEVAAVIQRLVQESLT